MNAVDFVRIPQLYEPLTALDHNAKLVLWLAEEITPNRDATEWTIRVRDGITFHNGKPLGADDVIFSFRRIINPKSPLAGASSLGPLDFRRMKKLDSRTARLYCTRPFSTFPEVQPGFYFYIVPEGYNPRRPVGTGPFVYHSFTPGVESHFLRNHNYWVPGQPYVDGVIIADYPDQVTQVNALLAHQLDAANFGLVSVAPTLISGGIRVIVSDTGFMTPFTMRVDKPPFNDIRVRQAMRFAIDRKAMREAVFSGRGLLGNDIFSPYDPAYPHSLRQRHQDIPRAKYLLKRAGHKTLPVVLTTADISPGTVAAAQVLAQQASAAGFRVQINKITPTTFFGKNYLQWDFSQDYWYYLPYLVQCGESTIKGAFFSESKFADPRYNFLYREALATVNKAKRDEIVREMMMIDYDRGPYIIPYFVPAINGYANNLRGTVPDKTGVPLANADLRSLYFA